VRRAVYLGRFQLFHLGHCDVLEHIAARDDVDEIVIAIGSTQYDGDHKSPAWPWANNPFTHAERREMIERSLAARGHLGKPWVMVGVPDTHEHESWFAGLVAAVGEFAVLYSSDARERAFFGAHGKEARDFPRRFSYHAGSIRRRIADGVDHLPFVPAGTAAVLERIGARRRMHALYERDRAGGT
jgi:nicotinamide-nucleotide adenylyltransferase